MNSFTNPPPSKPRNITVIQGEVEISNDPAVTLTTILGSCISVCMWDEEAKIGGMNHFLLAQVSGSRNIKDGAYAIEMLINKLLRAGAQRSALQTKIFGGASMAGIKSDIGLKNGEFARSFLANEAIPCVAESIGGTQARRVRFLPTTGKAQLLLVQPAEVAPLKKVAPPPVDDITLF